VRKAELSTSDVDGDMMVKMPSSLGCSKRCWRRWETLLRRKVELNGGRREDRESVVKLPMAVVMISSAMGWS